PPQQCNAEAGGKVVGGGDQDGADPGAGRSQGMGRLNQRIVFHFSSLPYISPQLPSREARLSNLPLISIVDDDDSVRNATKGLLRSLGYDVAAFASAEEFLHSGRINDTSCLVADVRMPGLNGIDLQRLLLESGHRMPVIFITAFPDEGLRARALRQGA